MNNATNETVAYKNGFSDGAECVRDLDPEALVGDPGSGSEGLINGADTETVATCLGLTVEQVEKGDSEEWDRAMAEYDRGFSAGWYAQVALIQAAE